MEELEKILKKVSQGITSPQAKEDIEPKFENRWQISQYLASLFPSVALTLDDYYLAELGAYKAAAEKQAKEQQILEQQKRRESFLRMWTYDEMQAKAIEYGNLLAIQEDFSNGFVIDQYNKEVFHLLCLYFTNDPEFEKYGLKDDNGRIIKNYSLKKGIWLQSNERGVGKSTLLKCFSINKRCCFGYQSTHELAAKFQKQGFSGIDYFMSTIPQPATASNFYQSEAGFMYDELFGEKKVNAHGTQLLVSEHIISSLYDFSNNKKGQMWKFHCTSNASGEDIEKISGITYRTRMPDMYNLIQMGGKNRRI